MWSRNFRSFLSLSFSLLSLKLRWKKREIETKQNSNTKSFIALKKRKYTVHTYDTHAFLDVLYCVNVQNLLRVMLVLLWGYCLRTKLRHFIITFIFFFLFADNRNECNATGTVKIVPNHLNQNSFETRIYCLSIKS